MPFFVAFIAGVVIGSAVVALILSKRWKQQTDEVKAALDEMAEQHLAEKEENKNLTQQLADVNYQLNEAKKDLAAAKK